MNKLDINELIKEIDIRGERANDGIMPTKIFFLLQELGVSADHYFEIIKVYLQFFKEEVKSTKEDETK